MHWLIRVFSFTVRVLTKIGLFHIREVDNDCTIQEIHICTYRLFQHNGSVFVCVFVCVYVCVCVCLCVYVCVCRVCNRCVGAVALLTKISPGAMYIITPYSCIMYAGLH